MILERVRRGKFQKVPDSPDPSQAADSFSVSDTGLHQTLQGKSIHL